MLEDIKAKEKEIIKEIREVQNESFDEGSSEGDGYIITTNLRKLRFLIENDRQCCESWGYLTIQEDDQKSLCDFEGAEIFNVYTVNECLKVKDLETRDIEGEYTIFINIDTDRGTLQLVAYNDHNGYYGHEVVFEEEKNKIIERRCL